MDNKWKTNQNKWKLSGKCIVDKWKIIGRCMETIWETS